MNEDKYIDSMSFKQCQRGHVVKVSTELPSVKWREPDKYMAAYLAACEKYHRELDRRGTWRYRLAALATNLWSKAWGSIVLIAVTTGLAIGLCAQEGRWVTAEVTAYCPCSLCCGTDDRLTANNTSTDRVPYAFAADRSLNFGARVFVPLGLGVLDRVRADDRWFSVDDRGGALDTEAQKRGVLRLDLRFREHAWAVRFGRRRVIVFVCDEPWEAP